VGNHQLVEVKGDLLAAAGVLDKGVHDNRDPLAGGEQVNARKQ